MVSRHAMAYKNSQQMWLCSLELHKGRREEIAVPSPTPIVEVPVTDGKKGRGEKKSI